MCRDIIGPLQFRMKYVAGDRVRLSRLDASQRHDFKFQINKSGIPDLLSINLSILSSKSWKINSHLPTIQSLQKWA